MGGCIIVFSDLYKEDKIPAVWKLQDNSSICSGLPRQCNQSGCPDPTDQRHILDVEGRVGSVDM